MTTDRNAWIEAHRDYLEAHTPEHESVPIPLHGVRIVAALGPGGKPTFYWQFDNSEAVNPFELAGFLHFLADEVGRHGPRGMT